MPGRPTTVASSRPCVADHSEQPMSHWSDPEPPSNLHNRPKNRAYLAHHYYEQQQPQGQPQQLPKKPHLYTQRESYVGEELGGDVFASKPLLTAGQPPQPHKMHYSQSQHQHQQPMSQRGYLTAAK